MREGVLLCAVEEKRSQFIEDIEEGGAVKTYLAVTDDVEQGDDVGASGEVLQNLDLSLDLLLLDGLEDLDDAFLVVGDVDSLENLRVFTTTCV